MASSPPRKLEVVIVPEPMTNWFAPRELLRTGVKSFFGALFGSYSDRRETQAALAANQQSANRSYQDFVKYDELWIDYVADLGDGWDSTYTVAELLARDSLKFNHIETRRGDILVMGGDQVYPAAGAAEYQSRLVNPYRCALPWVEGERPALFAIPGNHDWYDGLGSFLKLFCQNRSLGGWCTVQDRSYFALKLPHHWWLWAVDIALETDIDKPQINYFSEIAKNELKPGDRVILCTPTSSWVDAGVESSDGASRPYLNLNVLADKVRERKASIPVMLAGDLHHYSHYRHRNGKRHKFTAGGGGAFLLGTQQLPKALTLYETRRQEDEGAAAQEYHLVASFPSPGKSRWLSLGALGFAFRNVAFSLFLGVFYLFYGWLLQAASKVPNPHLGGKTLLESLATVPFGFETFFTTVLKQVYWVLAHSPANVLATIVPVIGLWAFCDARRGVAGRVNRLVWGGGHGVLHVLLAILLIWTSAWINLIVLPAPNGLAGAGWLDHPYQVLLFSAEMLVSGAILGGTLMGVYLVLANAVSGLHLQEVFSSQAIGDYKNFLRLHLTRERLVIYPVGVKRVHQRWKPGPTVNARQPPTGAPWGSWSFSVMEGREGSWLKPDDSDGEPFLIEAPVPITRD